MLSKLAWSKSLKTWTKQTQSAMGCNDTAVHYGNLEWTSSCYSIVWKPPSVTSTWPRASLPRSKRTCRDDKTPCIFDPHSIPGVQREKGEWSLAKSTIQMKDRGQESLPLHGSNMIESYSALQLSCSSWNVMKQMKVQLKCAIVDTMTRADVLCCQWQIRPETLMLNRKASHLLIGQQFLVQQPIHFQIKYTLYTHRLGCPPSQ